MKTKLPVIAALLSGVAIAVVAMLVIGGGDEQQSPAPASASAHLKDGTRLAGPDDAYSLEYPKGWKRLTAKDVGGKGDEPVPAIRSGDGAAMLMVQQAGKLDGPLDEVADGLTKSLSKKLADFRFVKSSKIELPAGDAVSYTFVRTKSGRVQNLVVVPSKARTYTLNSVMGGDAEGAAQQLAAIVKTFDAKD